MGKMAVRLGGFAIGGLAFIVIFSWRASYEWSNLQYKSSGEYSGWATLASDPEPGNVTRVLFKIDGTRFVAYAHGIDARRIGEALAGERLHVRGRLDADAPRYLRWRHVVGRIDLDEVSERIDPGGALVRATNRIRRTIVSGARTMSADNSALFAGLVIGDDRNQSPALVNDFRAAGMTHLTAVSGQNVALVLAAFAPLLIRLRPRMRFLVSVALIAWFVLMTRAEPSVLRAAGMSVISAYGFLRGKKWSTVWELTTCVIAMLIIDPLLAWSVGWWLSVSASFGIAVAAKPIASLLPLPRGLSDVVGATAAAQLATTPISVLVFGRIAPLGLLANVLAVPVAGVIMFVGIPLGLLAGILPDELASLVMAPLELAVWWVKIVAGFFAM